MSYNEIDDYLDNKMLNNAMALYIPTDLPFYEEYEEVRSIDDPITNHLDFWGYMTLEITKLAIHNGAVTVIRYLADGSLDYANAVKKLTTKTGYFGFDGMEPDKYLAIFEFEDCDKLEKDIYLYAGQSVRLDIALRRTE